jgi:hypothetical protein
MINTAFGIWSSHSGRYEQYYLLGYNAGYSVESQPTFRTNISPPSSGSNKKRKIPARKHVTTFLSHAFALWSFGWLSTDWLHGVISLNILLLINDRYQSCIFLEWQIVRRKCAIHGKSTWTIPKWRPHNLWQEQMPASAVGYSDSNIRQVAGLARGRDVRLSNQNKLRVGRCTVATHWC